jgi:hypothetical protein
MIKKIISILVFSLIMVGTVYATSTNRVGNVIEITELNADWFWSSVVRPDQYFYIVSIEFIGGNINDTLIVRNQSLIGPVMFKRTIFDTEYRFFNKVFGGVKLQPAIKFSECVVSTGHKIIIILGN